MTQGWRVETRLCPGTGTLCGYSPGRDSLGLGSWDGSYWRDTRDGFGLWTGFEVLDTLHRTSLASGGTGDEQLEKRSILKWGAVPRQSDNRTVRLLGLGLASQSESRTCVANVM